MSSVPSLADIQSMHKRYSGGDERLFELVFTHCQIVADIALWCADQIDEAVDLELLKAACLLHDIGSYSYMHEAYERNVYAQHALLGAKILEAEGVDQLICDAVETHVLMGLTKQDITTAGMRLPERDFIPNSIYGEILCYADRFHSKSPVFNSYDYFVERMSNLPTQQAKLIAAAERFGIPDIASLAKKYGQPVR